MKPRNVSGRHLLLLCSLTLAGCAGNGKNATHDLPAQTVETALTRLPTGAQLDPAGRSIAVGNMPLGALATADHRLVVVSLSGWREQGIQVIDRASGRVVQRVPERGAFLGLAWSADARTLYVSGGSAEVVYTYAWNAAGAPYATLADSIVLAEILRRVTGKPFDELVRESFGQKLGMKQFGMFRFGVPARSYVQPNGEFSDVDGLINFGVYGASGGAFGTIGDLWLFDHALLSSRLLPARQRELMWESSRQNGFYGFHQWIFPAKLAGCGKEMRVVERQGLVGGIELRNYLLPETGQALILFSRHRPSDFGDPWEGKGLAFDLLSPVVCR